MGSSETNTGPLMDVCVCGREVETSQVLLLDQ